MSLDLKYRPKDFSEVVGQRAISVILSAMIAKEALSQVLLFTGPSGVGKTSMARIIAAQLNSEGAEQVREGTHTSVLEIDGASNGSVEAIRELKRSLQYSFTGNRVIIIDEVHSISSQAFDALLNLLEFPPKNVTFILCTTEVHELEAAIRHRCDRYNFKRASVQDLKTHLAFVVEKEGIQIDNNMLDLIAQRSEGSYRESLKLLEQAWLGNIHTIEEYNDLQGEVDYGPALIAATIGGPLSAILKLESVLRYTNAEEVADRAVETIKDVMLLKGGVGLLYDGSALESRLELASKVETARLVKSMRILWDLQTKLADGDPIRGLEMAFSMIGEAMEVPNTVIKTVSAEPHPAVAPMSLKDMQNFNS